MQRTIASLAATIACAGALSAQQPAPAAPPLQLPTHQPGQAGPGALLTKGLVGFVVEQPQTLNLNERQVARSREIAERLMAENAVLHARAITITGGPEARNRTPERRSQARTAAQPILDSMRVNDDRATEELRSLLTPEQRTRLDGIQQQYRVRTTAGTGQGRGAGRGMGAGQGRGGWAVSGVRQMGRGAHHGHGMMAGHRAHGSRHGMRHMAM